VLPIKVGVCAPVGSAGVAKAAGVDFLEENVQGFLVPEAPEDEFAPKLEAASASPVPVTVANCFLPGGIKCVGPQVDAARILRYAETAFRRAEAVGIRTIVFGSCTSRSLAEGVHREDAVVQLAELMRLLGPRAEARGIVITIEPLNSGECNFINSLAEGAELVERSSHPSVRLLADFYHMARDKEPPGEIVRYGPLIVHAHVAEAERRTRPGLMGDDFRPYLRALVNAGRCGALSIESGWENLAEECAASVRLLREQIAEAGGR